MKPEISRLNEAVLLRMGFDPVTVKALANMARVTGTASNGATVSEVGERSDNTEIMLGGLRDQIEALKVVVELLGANPEPATADLSRFDAYALAPPAPTTRQIEHLATEVRQIAEQQAAMMKTIDELKIGMKP